MNTRYTNTIAAILLILASFAHKAGAQAVVTSNSGKSATFNISLNSISATNVATWGYNYDYNLQYSVSLNNAPTIYYVSVTFESGTNNTFSFGLSQSDVATGSGTLKTSNNQGRNVSDNSTATPYSLNARNMKIAVYFSDGTVEKTFTLARPASASGAMTTNSLASGSQSNTPLPVKLLSFDGNAAGNNVALTWATASEMNNAYFLLERSADAKSWETLTQIEGAGTTTSGNTYQYTDNNPLNGTAYYRLKQVDADGSFTYSKVLNIKADAPTTTAITLYPNPNNGEQVHFAGVQNAADWSVKVVNSSAAVLYQSATMSEGIDLPSLTTGMYFVQLQNSKTGETQVLKLVRK